MDVCVVPRRNCWSRSRAEMAASNGGDCSSNYGEKKAKARISRCFDATVRLGHE